MGNGVSKEVIFILKIDSQKIEFNSLLNRLRSSKILLAGLNGLGAEIAKNIILSGVKQVTFLDSSKVQDTDFCSQFFLSRSSIGENRADASLIRAQALNPMVEIKVDKSKLSEKSDDFFHDFDVVCILEAPLEELIRIDKICREQKIKFFAADLWGMFGFSFADLQVHEFVEWVFPDASCFYWDFLEILKDYLEI